MNNTELLSHSLRFVNDNNLQDHDPDLANKLASWYIKASLTEGSRVKVISNDYSKHNFGIGRLLTVYKKHKSVDVWFCRRWRFGKKQVLHITEFNIIK